MRSKLIMSSMILSMLLTACAMNESRPNADAKPAVKRAWIVGFFTADTPRSELPNCLASLPSDELAAKRFVRLHYRHVRKMINEVAELPSGVEAKVDDMVEVLPRDCDKGNLSQITRMLPESAF